jgi:UDP-2,3-diacylglucosamine pyrophosphatase LpxH
MAKQIRTLFISDLHLGTRGCQAAALLSFLKTVEAEQIYLVGDIVDGWRLRQSWHWPQLHNDVVQKLLRRARKGNRVILIPGNHDEFLRDYVGSNFGGVEIMEEAIHTTATGRRMLILHGDKFDTVVRNVRWLALLGDCAYDFAIWLNRHIGRVRRHFGLPYWSFSAYAKQKVKRAVSFISAFEEAVVADAARHGVDAVLCGHIHQACIRNMRGIEYFNTGDWVESCSAILEHLDGRLELVRWTSHETDHASISAEVLRPAA